MSKLKEALKSQGHAIGEMAIRELLKGMGFSLKANKKAIEGAAHADRDAQFQQINRTGKAFEAAGKPMISVDCKQKELIGNFKNNGREWQATGQNTTVNVYDYRSIAGANGSQCSPFSHLLPLTFPFFHFREFRPVSLCFLAFISLRIPWACLRLDPTPIMEIAHPPNRKDHLHDTARLDSLSR